MDGNGSSHCLVEHYPRILLLIRHSHMQSQMWRLLEHLSIDSFKTCIACYKAVSDLVQTPSINANSDNTVEKLCSGLFAVRIHTMRSFDQMSEPILESSLNNRIEQLPIELIDRIVEACLFSEPLGSHDALHSLQAFCQETKQSFLTSRIQAEFESFSFRKRVETAWKLCPNFEHTKTCRHRFDRTAPHDLASRTIANCAQCFEYLLDRQTIRASSFCQNGQSFHLIAVKSENPDVINRVLSSIEPQDFFEPASVNGTPIESKKILQFTTWHADWFKKCWERHRLRPELSLSIFGPSEIENLCQFATIDLANELCHRGVDLGIPDPPNGNPYWNAILHQETPEPMLWWLWSRGLVPPAGLLTYAATHNCVKAAGWILQHTNSYEDWRNAAFVAADILEPESSEIFKLITQHPCPEHRTDRAFSQDLLIRIVNKACDKIRFYESYLSGNPFNGRMIDIHSLHSAKARLEEISVCKIQAVRVMNDYAGVTGMKVQASLAFLDVIREALEAFKQ